jgi:hypothetical protein
VALTARLRDARPAGVLADVGIRACCDGCVAWIDSAERDPLVDAVAAELAVVESAIVRPAISTRAVTARRP